ncbi:LysR family transcriptional regulator [Rhizobium sp. P40RR-XXII]|uniref:LysR substrate-binding domain-containing protein n=1 Tax=unclassified Rhizobium TaxID=2613769 RepID=UPI001456CD8D|nr:MULTISPECIES: LysR substrate-binding domain-containing protein [unclassified Rhizobium]NLR85127.1 LysR family transcriptional regulator [Rhizobium sp. P28RR-XV]NLS16897.1 LysR family transcriptional regulator [Rhizobium sp. P40RR-XXII]
MSLNLNDLQIFVQAVDNGGFAATARRLGMPKSTISKRIAALEADLDTRLLHRTSRSFMLTDPGRAFYEHATAALVEAEAAESAVRQRHAEPSGIVRITASVPAAQFVLSDHLPSLAAAYPKLTLQLHATDRFVDLVQEGFDIAVRSHFSPLPDSELLQRQVSIDDVILVAAPAYRERHGSPADPQALQDHDGLLVSQTAKTWQLQHPERGSLAVSPRRRFVADETLVLLRAAISGLGIACLPGASCKAAIEAGQIVRVLPGWTAGSVTTTILTTHRRGQLPGVRAVVEFLARGLQANRNDRDGPGRA